MKDKKKGAVGRFFAWLGADLKEIGKTFSEGDWKTRVSYLIFGFGQIMRGQLVKGITMLLLEAAGLYFIIGFGSQYLGKFLTLGTK